MKRRLSIVVILVWGFVIVLGANSILAYGFLSDYDNKSDLRQIHAEALVSDLSGIGDIFLTSI